MSEETDNRSGWLEFFRRPWAGWVGPVAGGMFIAAPLYLLFPKANRLSWFSDYGAVQLFTAKSLPLMESALALHQIDPIWYLLFLILPVVVLFSLRYRRYALILVLALTYPVWKLEVFLLRDLYSGPLRPDWVLSSETRLHYKPEPVEVFNFSRELNVALTAAIAVIALALIFRALGHFRKLNITPVQWVLSGSAVALIPAAGLLLLPSMPATVSSDDLPYVLHAPEIAMGWTSAGISFVVLLALASIVLVEVLGTRRPNLIPACLTLAMGISIAGFTYINLPSKPGSAAQQIDKILAASQKLPIISTMGSERWSPNVTPGMSSVGFSSRAEKLRRLISSHPHQATWLAKEQSWSLMDDLRWSHSSEGVENLLFLQRHLPLHQVSSPYWVGSAPINQTEANQLVSYAVSTPTLAEADVELLSNLVSGNYPTQARELARYIRKTAKRAKSFESEQQYESPEHLSPAVEFLMKQLDAQARPSGGRTVRLTLSSLEGAPIRNTPIGLQLSSRLEKSFVIGRPVPYKTALAPPHDVISAKYKFTNSNGIVRFRGLRNVGYQIVTVSGWPGSELEFDELAFPSKALPDPLAPNRTSVEIREIPIGHYTPTGSKRSKRIELTPETSSDPILIDPARAPKERVSEPWTGKPLENLNKLPEKPGEWLTSPNQSTIFKHWLSELNDQNMPVRIWRPSNYAEKIRKHLKELEP